MTERHSRQQPCVLFLTTLQGLYEMLAMNQLTTDHVRKQLPLCLMEYWVHRSGMLYCLFIDTDTRQNLLYDMLGYQSIRFSQHI
jgi:hypothetical protein